jgi:hypothetical protein
MLIGFEFEVTADLESIQSENLTTLGSRANGFDQGSPSKRKVMNVI